MSSSSTPSAVTDAFRTTLDLFETGLDLMRQNLRRSHPEAPAEEIEQLLQQWLMDRPGAKAGDCPGRPVDLNNRRVDLEVKSGTVVSGARGHMQHMSRT